MRRGRGGAITYESSQDSTRGSKSSVRFLVHCSHCFGFVLALLVLPSLLPATEGFLPAKFKLSVSFNQQQQQQRIGVASLKMPTLLVTW